MKILALALAFSISVAAAQTPAHSDDTLIFQTANGWSPRVNVEAGTVMTYGINRDLPERIRSWKDHGYRVSVMTGVAWGEYGDYLRGDFDGKQHWNETQQESDGKLIQHGGREVPYVSPTASYGNYLARGVLRALEAGADAIYLEEPEFWARAGWSDSFKAEWQRFYGEPWRAPDSSPDAQYRASRLKYVLYQRALAQVFTAVRQWGEQHGRRVPCYVATHSLINYAQWAIVSPESSLLDVGADGYIAQVWTGTSRAVNRYQGIEAERTFETAFLEYGALQNIARSSGKRIWYLNDPIEDNPNHSWVDYQHNWESTLVASLLQPQVSSYEILPWPDRIFGPRALYPATEPTDAVPHPAKTLIPAAYQTELQTVFHALGQMSNQPAHWQVAGTADVGILVSDTLMFERAKPLPSDPDLGNFYGFALPLVMHGIPAEAVQIESTYRGQNASDLLKQYRILLLTYEGQKPPSPKFHEALAAWVEAGGALVLVDNNTDPYNHAADWWNSNGQTAATPRDLLLRNLDLSPGNKVSASGKGVVLSDPSSPTPGLYRDGKGFVLFGNESPSALAASPTGAQDLLALTRQAAAAIHLPWKETTAFVLRRGPFVIAAGFDQPAGTPEHPVTRVAGNAVKPVDGGTPPPPHAVADAPAHTPPPPTVIPGRFIDLFDPHLRLVTDPHVGEGDRRLLLDPAFFPATAARVLAASGRVTGEQSTATSLHFTISGIAGRDEHDLAVIRLLLPRPAKAVLLNNQPLSHRTAEGGTVLLEIEAGTAPQAVTVTF